MRTTPTANPLVLLLLAVLGPAVAIRLTDPASIGSGPFDLLLATGIGALLLVSHHEKKRGLDDA